MSQPDGQRPRIAISNLVIEKKWRAALLLLDKGVSGCGGPLDLSEFHVWLKFLEKTAFWVRILRMRSYENCSTWTLGFYSLALKWAYLCPTQTDSSRSAKYTIWSIDLQGLTDATDFCVVCTATKRIFTKFTTITQQLIAVVISSKELESTYQCRRSHRKDGL